MSKITLVGSVLVLVVACTSNTTTTNHPDGGSGSGSGNGTAYVPKIGPWSYSQVTLVSTTCSQNVNNGEAGNFGIDSASSSSFHVLPNDGNMDFSCSLANSAFDCPNRIAQVYDYRPSFDAVVTIHVDANGTFTSSTRASGTQDATVDCSGAGCSAYGPFPCDFTQDFVIQAF